MNSETVISFPRVGMSSPAIFINLWREKVLAANGSAKSRIVGQAQSAVGSDRLGRSLFHVAADSRLGIHERQAANDPGGVLVSVRLDPCRGALEIGIRHGSGTDGRHLTPDFSLSCLRGH